MGALSCVTSGEWLSLSGPQPKGSGMMRGELWCGGEVQAPPANTHLVLFLGNLQGAGCLLRVLAESPGVGVWTSGCGEKPPENLGGPWRLGLACRGCGWHGGRPFLRRFPGVPRGKRELTPMGIWLR